MTSRICQTVLPPMVALTRTLAPMAVRLATAPSSWNLIQWFVLPRL